nr:putative ribonuclease H-like domain-containing protein [Tanacetum cinerariifolium]
MHEELIQFKMQKVWVLGDFPNGKTAIGTKWGFRNKKDERGIMVKNKARLVAQGHTQEKGIDYEEVFAPVERIEAIRLFLAYASFMGFMVYQMDVKSDFLYGTIEEEVYVCQPLGFEDPDYHDKVYKVVKALYGLHQAPRACKDLCKAFKKIMKDNFQMSSMGELTFFLDGKSSSTPIDTEKPLLKDPDGEDVDVHTYRSMIGSLMLISWQCKKKTVIATSSTEAEYVAAVATSSMKSLEMILHVINILSAGSLTTTQMVLNSPCLTHINNLLVQIKWSLNVNGVIRLQALVDKKKVIITEATIRDAFRLADAEGIDCLPNEEISTKLLRMGVGKGFYRADTPLFEGMIVAQEVGEGAVKVNVEDVTAASVAAEGTASVADDDVYVAVDKSSIPLTTPPTQPPPPSQDIPSTSQVQPTPSPSPTAQPPSPQQQPQPSQDTKMLMDLLYTLLETWGIIANIDADENVILEDAKEVDVDAKIKESVDVQGRQAESQAQIYQIDLENANKVLSMQDEESEPAELQKVVEVVTTAKLITKVITAASATITAADTSIPAATITAATPTLTTAPSVARRRKGVVIRDPEETTTPSTIIHTKPKSKDKGKKCNSNVAFLEKTNEQMEEEDSKALKRISESQENKAAKRQKINEEVKELRRHLQIVPNDEDAVYTEATPFAFKVPVVDYEIYIKNNKPYYKIKRADTRCTSSNLEKSKKCSWSSKGQELEAVRVLWCAGYYIYYNTVDFTSKEEISTYKVHSGSDAQQHMT